MPNSVPETSTRHVLVCPSKCNNYHCAHESCMKDNTCNAERLKIERDENVVKNDVKFIILTTIYNHSMFNNVFMSKLGWKWRNLDCRTRY